MGYVMLRHLAIPENRLGTTGELAGVAARHAAGLFPVTVRSVCCDDPADLLGQTCTPADRFGGSTFLQA